MAVHIPAFVFHSNRAAAVFAAALVPLGGRQYQAGDRQIDFLYFDQYGGKQLPGDVEIGYQLIDRQRTIPLDDKSSMALLLAQAGINYPAVYFNPQQVPRDATALWYIKAPGSTAGKGICLAGYDELEDNWQPGQIIQQAIENLALVNGRKFSVRLYVLVNQGVISLFDEGFMVLHGAPYVTGSRDPIVQFSHDGYMKATSPVSLRRFTGFAHASVVKERLPAYLGRLFRAFANQLGFEEANRYCLFGIDLLIRDDFEPVLVEINDRPNFLHTAAINSSVNVPMVKSAYLTLSGVNRGEDSDRSGADPCFRRIGSLHD